MSGATGKPAEFSHPCSTVRWQNRGMKTSGTTPSNAVTTGILVREAYNADRA